MGGSVIGILFDKPDPSTERCSFSEQSGIGFRALGEKGAQEMKRRTCILDGALRALRPIFSMPLEGFVPLLSELCAGETFRPVIEYLAACKGEIIERHEL